MIKVSVSASKNYNVIMKKELLASASDYIKEAFALKSDPVTGKINSKKLCIVTDATVDALYGGHDQALQTSLTAAGFDVYKYVFPGGEDNKNMKTICGILDFLANNKFTRSDLLLALGGGITGDVTGFAAATYLRGIDFIQVPTTLLAIVDSSVGGKTGVNLNAGKNLAGAFWQPGLVLFDPDVLDTLSYDIKLDGIAEAIKAGAIADPEIIDMIRNSTAAEDHGFLMEIAARAIRVKRKVVEEDERDHGSRQLLNFGHTLAHAIEKCSSFSISHGHAVAIGMDIVSAASQKSGWSDESCSGIITETLEKFSFPLKCPFSARELTEAALQDKKIRGAEITLVIPEAISRCVLRTIPVEDLESFISCGLQSRKDK